MSVDAMKQVLEALALFASDESDKGQIAIAAHEALRQAIEQAEKQKPVVIPEGFSLVAVKGFDDLMYWLDRCERKGHLENCPDLVEPYEAFEYRIIDANPPPQREWVGLTDEEREAEINEAGFGCVNIARAIEAKLKEKNT